MEIDQTINKWFEETTKKIDSLPNKQGEIEGFCLAVLHTAMIYLNSAQLLQKEGLNFPAMALLRIVSDVVIKFLWCLQGKKNDEIEKRIKRWEKKSINGQKKLLEELKDLVSDSAKDIFKNGIKDLNKRTNNQLKEMPNTRQLFGENTNLFLSDIYARAYLQFNSSVHIDTSITKKVLTSPLRKQGCNKDVKLSQIDSNNLKIFRLSFLYMVLIMIYKHYSWNSTQMYKEYESIVSCFEK